MTLKPLDNLILGMGASSRAVTKVNARWPRNRIAPEAEPAVDEGEGSTVRRRPIDRRIAPAGWLAMAREQGHIEQLEKPSLSRPERAEAG
jgi:hypothetical protein